MSVEEEPKGFTWVPPFGTYLDYIKAIRGKWPEYSELQSDLEHAKSNQNGRIHIQDIRSDGTYCDTANFTHNEANIVKRLKDTLADSPAFIRTRIVFIEYRSSKAFDPHYRRQEDVPLGDGLWSTIGLMLDIEPLFFEASWNRGLTLKRREYPNRPEFLRMGYTSIKLLKGHCTGTSRISIAIVAINATLKPSGCGIQYMVHSPPSLWKCDKNSVQSSQRMRPLDLPNAAKPLSSFAALKDTGQEDIVDIFISMVRAKQTSSSDEDLFHCLCTMSRVEVTFFRSSMCDFYRLWDVMTGEPLGQMATQLREKWRPCRRRLDNFRVSLQAFGRYTKRHFSQSEYEERLAELQDDQTDGLLEGQIIEAMLKDDMQFSVGNVQVEVGRSALKESRLSIEEGKRVQLITTLAFIFIPLNLAPSIFGMNVQELNNTGKSIWQFVVTAVGLGILSVGGWYLSFNVFFVSKEQAKARVISRPVNIA